MSVFTRPRATAQRLLGKYGAALVLTRTVPGAYDPDTGAPGAPTVTTFTGIGFRQDYELKDIDGTLIRRGDVKLLIGPKCADGTDMPKPAPATDAIAFAGSTYQVVQADPLSPAGEDVMFTVQARA